MLSGSEDNIVAYRIVHVPDSPKNNHTIHNAPISVNNTATSDVPLQYFVIDSANGFLQAVPATQLTTVSNSPVKIEQIQTSPSTNSLKIRSSVAIAPKIESTGPYSKPASGANSSSKSNVISIT